MRLRDLHPTPRPLPRNRILVGDARTQLRQLPAGSVDCIITSPPYAGLRRYGSGAGEIGSETSAGAFVTELLTVCDELARVLKPTGSLWLNIGDSFSRSAAWGAPPKGMLLVPERLLIGLADRGWLVRAKVIWSKPNPMPNSVRDRFSCSHEVVFHLVRQPTYLFDLDAVRIPHTSTRRGLTAGAPYATAKTGGTNRSTKESTRRAWAGPLANGINDGLARARAEGRAGHPLGKNPGDVWTIATAGFRGPHPAVYPERLVERPLLATCPVRVCATCGAPWHQSALKPSGPGCTCRSPHVPGVVLDPFMGSGTTGVVAHRHARSWIGIELNAEFAGEVGGGEADRADGRAQAGDVPAIVYERAQLVL